MLGILSHLYEVGHKNLVFEPLLSEKIAFFKVFEAWISGIRGFPWDIFGI